MLKLDISRVYDFVKKADIDNLEKETMKQQEKLHRGNGAGNDFLGWLHLPSSITEEHLIDIERTAKSLGEKAEVVVVAGIGGSYLGARAVIEALGGSFEWLKPKPGFPTIIFAGQNLVEDYLAELIGLLNNKTYGIVVISKSGTTTEPALAFRLLRDHLERKVGKERARELIVAITDKEKGALKKVATDEGYKTYVIPDDIGGRYSVLTPVGLVPIAIAGYSVRELVKGAADMEKNTAEDIPFAENPGALYAAVRNALYRKDKKIEILANFHDKLVWFSEWWKQLFGESEGKENKGIYPASVHFTADLHSMGQYIQEGERHIFETVISVKQPGHHLVVPSDREDLDQLNYLAGKRVDEVNKMAELGTMLAHVDGGVPNIKIEIEKINEYNIGQLIYFFEKACGISGYMLGVNPFNQPGVEAYKKNMFALLEKPGFEQETRAIKNKL